MTAQMAWWAGLIASICGALIGENVVPDPYHRYVTIAFLVSTAVSGYKIQNKAPEANQ